MFVIIRWFLEMVGATKAKEDEILEGIGDAMIKEEGIP
jgi:hypothetical protein